MMNVLTFLRGKKTYILVACALAVAGLDLIGVINDASANTALVVLGFGTVATLRAGIMNALAKAKAEGAAEKPAA
jgi:hypothetical protein